MYQDKKDYIFPNLFKLRSLNDIEEIKTLGPLSVDESIRITSFYDVLSLNNALVLSEPGFGKTELLKHLNAYAKDNNFSSLYVELRSYTKENNLENFITDEATISSQPFSIVNNENVVLFLDAFDEAKHDSFSELIRQIKVFHKQYPKIKLFTSCRLHFYQRFPELDDQNLPIIYIDKFTFRDVRTYLQRNGFEDKDIDEIIQEFREPNWESIILIPRYLEKFVSFYRSSKLAFKPTKSDLYNKFVNERLKEEDAKRSAEDSELFRRFLEKLALVNEIYQSNEIAKDELITVLDDIKSNILVGFLTKTDLRTLYNSSLILVKGNTISFEDHTLQEYLASCELLRLGGQKRIFDLAVVEELHEINPSWVNTLTFVLDRDKSLIESVLEFGRRFNLEDRHEGAPLFYLELLTRVDISKIEKEQGERIFRKVFERYQQDCIWIDWEIAERLRKFYTPSLHHFLQGFVDGRKLKKKSSVEQYVKKGNAAFMVGLLVEKELLTDRQQRYWKKKLINYANDKNENGVLQRHALIALGHFQDSRLINRVEKTFYHSSDLVGQGFLNFCKETDPNSEISLNYFISGLKSESINKRIAARFGIYEVTSRESISKFLKAATEDQHLLRKLADSEKEDSKIISNIHQIYNSTIQEQLIEIVFRLVKIYMHDSPLLEQIAKLLKEKEKNIIDIIFSKIKQDKATKRILFEFETFFSIVLDLENLDSFAQQIKGMEDSDWVAYRILQWIKLRRGEDGQKIYNAGQKHFYQIYQEIEKKQKEFEKQPSREEKLCEEFRQKLEPAPNMYDSSVFGFYFDNSEILEKSLTEDDLKRLKKLTTNLIGKIDTRKFRITNQEFDSETNELRSWTEAGNIGLFSDLIECSTKLNVGLSKYRQKLIDLIHFLHSSESDILEVIFQIIGTTFSKERKQILQFLEKPHYIAIPTYLALCKRFNILESIGYLKNWLNDEHISEYDKGKVLETIEFLSPDSSFLKTIFNTHDVKIREKANELLITNYGDREAVKWRLEQLKGKKVKREGRDIDVRWGRPFERDWADVLLKTQDSSLIPSFMDLIDYSYQAESEDKKYSEYAEHLRSLAIRYLDGLKSLSAIAELGRFIEAHPHYEGINWLRYKVREMKRNYLLYRGKPTSINEAINLYNKIKTAQYLSISTPEELANIVVNVLAGDFINWIENQGGYREFYYKHKKGNETKQRYSLKKEPDVQPIILGKIGDKLKLSGIDIWREVKKSDGPVDFLIHYGFAPSFKTILEVKYSSHRDYYKRKTEQIVNSKSFRQLHNKYLIGLEVDNGLFLMIRVKHEQNNLTDREWENLKINVEKACETVKEKKLMPVFIQAGTEELFK